MSKLVKLIGSGIVYTSDAIQATRNRPSSKDYTTSTASRDFPTGGNGDYMITKEETADALTQDGYAELPASPIQHECVELPAGSTHDVYSELPASPMNRGHAGLPGFSAPEDIAGPFAFPDENHQRGASQSGTQINEQISEPTKPDSSSIEHSESMYFSRMQRGIEPDVAFEQHYQITQRAGLPTYSESEFVAAAILNATAAPRTEEVEEQRNGDMIRTLLQMARSPHSVNRIPYPVVIPQSRPGYISEGFVRAYAPVLADCGISQDVFTNFQDNLHQTSMAANSIEVISIAANIVGNVPETASLITGMLVQIAAGTALETSPHRIGNTFLDRVNQELFMPRGLCALVISLKDRVPGPQHGRLGPLSQKFGETIFARETLEFDRPVANSRAVTASLDGPMGLPQAAPLVYPELYLPMTRSIRQKEIRKSRGSSESCGACQKLKVAGVWVQDYVEKKAQESKQHSPSLVTPRTMRGGLNSRSTGPSDPANNGKLISALSGGRLGNKPGLITRAANSIKESREPKRGMGFPSERTREKNQRYQDKSGPQIDVQHLFIVNMPSEDEVQQSVALLEHLLRQTGQLKAH